jgi:hypothetical protein
MKEEHQMKKKFSVYVMLFVSVAFLFASCGSDSDDPVPVDPNAAATVVVTSDKRIALANGIEDITLTALVTNASGSAISGKTVAFVITTGTGTLHSAAAATDASGKATVKVNRGPISPPPTKEDVTITATADIVSGTKTVRFINLPASASITVAIDPPISNLALLTFDLITSPTQTTTLLSIDPINEAVTAPFIGPGNPGQNTFASILNPPNTYTLFEGLPASTPGITTVQNSPIVGFVFAIDPSITALPTYEIGPDHITTSDPSGFPLLPALTQSNLVASVVFDTEL